MERERVVKYCSNNDENVCRGVAIVQRVCLFDDGVGGVIDAFSMAMKLLLVESRDLV